MNIQDHAYQLTAYEIGGAIDFKKYVEDIVKEQLEESEFSLVLEAYNKYCSDNNYEEFWINDEEFFDTFFPNSMEAVRATTYGDYRYTDDYVKLNGYENIDSYNEYQVIREILEDKTFHTYIVDYIEDFDFIDIEELLENGAEITLEAYKLVSKGY